MSKIFVNCTAAPVYVFEDFSGTNTQRITAVDAPSAVAQFKQLHPSVVAVFVDAYTFVEI